MNIAIVGSSHWHVPMCMPGIANAKAAVTAVWDYDRRAAAAFASRYQAAVFESPPQLARQAKVDAAFIFAKPVDMPAAARPFIDAGIPVSLEKPAGCNAAAVASLAELARARNTYASVALVQRHAGMGQFLLNYFQTSGEPLTELSVRFVAGSPDRYRRAHCDWVLDPAQSGGGALLNLGVHFIDLAFALSGAGVEVDELRCLTSKRRFGLAVEDHAALLLRMSSGAVVAIEAGYGYPDHEASAKRDFSAIAAGTDSYLQIDDSGARLSRRDGVTRRLSVNDDTDSYYSDYAEHVLQDIQTSQPAASTLEHMAAAMSVIDRAYLCG